MPILGSKVAMLRGRQEEKCGRCGSWQGGGKREGRETEKIGKRGKKERVNKREKKKKKGKERKRKIIGHRNKLYISILK